MRDLLPHVFAFLATWWVHAAVLIALVVLGLYLAGPVAARTRERFYRTALFGSVLSVLVATAWPLLGPRFEALPTRVAPATPLGRVEPAATWKVTPTRVLSAAVPSQPVVPVATLPAATAQFPWLPLALGLWMALGALALLRAWLGVHGLRRRLGARTPVEEPGFEGALTELARLAGLRRTPRLTSFEGPGVPVVLGGLRSEICVPTDALRLEPAARDALLAHELAHVQRRDALWLRAYAVLAAALPLNPFVRLATRRLRSLAERICDEQAVRWTRDPVGLAECLLTAATWLGTPRRTHLVPAMARDGRALKRRVEALLQAQPVRRAPLRTAILGVALCAAPLLLPAVVEAGPDGSVPDAPPARRALLLPGNVLGKHKPAGCTAPQVGGTERLEGLTRILALQQLDQEITALRTEIGALLPLLERLPESPARDRLRESLAARVQRIEADMRAAVRAHPFAEKESPK